MPIVTETSDVDLERRWAAWKARNDVAEGVTTAFPVTVGAFCFSPAGRMRRPLRIDVAAGFALNDALFVEPSSNR